MGAGDILLWELIGIIMGCRIICKLKGPRAHINSICLGLKVMPLTLDSLNPTSSKVLGFTVYGSILNPG